MYSKTVSFNGIQQKGLSSIHVNLSHFNLMMNPTTGEISKIPELIISLV
jgi:hypothetical protein